MASHSQQVPEFGLPKKLVSLPKSYPLVLKKGFLPSESVCHVLLLDMNGSLVEDAFKEKSVQALWYVVRPGYMVALFLLGWAMNVSLFTRYHIDYAAVLGITKDELLGRCSTRRKWTWKRPYRKTASSKAKLNWMLVPLRVQDSTSY